MHKLQIQTFKALDPDFWYLGARLLKLQIRTLGIQEPPKLRNQVSDQANLLRLWEVKNCSSIPRVCGRDKSSDPISAFLKQEVYFQNIEHMANGCQQPGFHSFYHRKTETV